jgi:hypothetical protein
VENGTGFINIPAGNPLSECSKKRVEGVTVTYEPEAGFTGPDSIKADAIYASGGFKKVHYAIDVK